MPWRNLTRDEWTMAFTGFGAIATAAGAYFVYAQISAASAALYGTNSYTVHKDLIESYDRALEAKDQLAAKGGQDPVLKAALNRQVLRLDTLIEADEGLYNNKGLLDDSWKHILQSFCPIFDRGSYRIEGFELQAAKTACDNGKTLWKVPSR